MEMKRNVWFALITIITVCCVIGGTFYHVFGRGGNFGGSGRIENMSLELDAFDALIVDANLMDVTVKTGERFHLSCEYTDELEPVYEIENGTLTIKQKSHWSHSWGVNNVQCSLTLTIPAQTAMDKVDVHTALGSVEIEGISASECSLQSNMGDCDLKDCSFAQSDLGTNMGGLSASGTALGKAWLDNDMGDSDIDNCTFDSLDITAAMGSVSISAAQALDGYDMNLEADLGSVHVNNHSQGTQYYQSGDAGKVSVRTNMGSIQLSY